MVDGESALSELRARLKAADPAIAATLSEGCWHPRLRRAVVYAPDGRRWASLRDDGLLWLGVELDGRIHAATLDDDGKLWPQGIAPAWLADLVLADEAASN